MSALINETEVQGIIAGKDRHTIRVVPVSQCGDTRQCSIGCGACGGNKKVKKITIEVGSTQQFEPGNPVTIRHYTINEFIGALVVFGIPLFFACLVLFTWYIFSPESVESAKAMISAGVAFAAGFAVIRIVDQQFSKRFPSRIISYRTSPSGTSSPAKQDSPHAG